MKRVIKEVVSTRVSLEVRHNRKHFMWCECGIATQTRDCINLKQKMDETDPLAFPLLQWCMIP